MGRCRTILFQGQKNENCDIEVESERVHKYIPFWVSGLEEIGSAKQYDLFVGVKIIGCDPTGKQTVLSLEKSHCLLLLMHFSLHHNFHTHLGLSRLMSIHTYILSLEAKLVKMTEDVQKVPRIQNTKNLYNTKYYHDFTYCIQSIIYIR
jgi:hypothetical protein